MKNTQIIIVNTLAVVIIATLFFFALTFILFNFFKIETSLKDTWSTLGSFFGGIATLSAAYIASLLFNDWRDEKNYDLENNLLTNILKDLKPIYVELLKIRSDSKNLKRIETAFIVKTDYLERDRLDLFVSMIKLFPNIKIYSEIKKDQTLVELYNDFDKHCYCFMDFFRILFLEKYRRYYDVTIEENKKMGHPPLRYYDIFKSYSDDRKSSLKIEINEVLTLFKKNAFEAEIGETRQRVTYEDWLQETIDLHDQIQDYCIKGLKVPD